MKRFLVFLLTFLFCQICFAQDHFEGRQEDPDMDALRKWIREKRMVSIKEIGGDLSLSGEVRIEFKGYNEKKDGFRQRGEGSATTNPDYASDVEVNLMLDYHSDRTWSSIKLEFDNDMGVQSGTTNHLTLEKAYFGGRMIDGDTFNFDGELGRRNLRDVFDSKVEFSAIFDGLLFKFNKAFESIGSYYVNIGAFLVDDYFDHYGEVAEMGLLRIANTGLYIKYAFINWKKHYSDFATNKRFNYAISQLQLGYQGTLARWDKFMKIYFAGLINHFADDLELSDKKYSHKYNLAWYVGISYGRILKGGDWALDVNFQYVMPQAVPDFDSDGIGRGNAAGVGLYTMNIDGTGPLTTQNTAVGNENFKGFSFELLYAITDNITLYQNFEISNNQTKEVGPYMTYKKYEMEFIYAF